MTDKAPPSSKTPAGDRIAKVLARAGVCSRRDAERMIEAGRVTVNGVVLTSPALNVTAKDKVLVDGKPLPTKEPTRLWRYHKERGTVTTARDPEGRPTVFDALPADLPRVISIGRLDVNTEGLLLLTNDGELARKLELPSTGWARRYRVRAHGRTDQAKLDALQKGIEVHGVRYGPIQARLEREQGANVWISMTLREGKNREIKRVLEKLGLNVNRLIRTSYGPFQLGDLKDGVVQEVPERILMDQLGETDRQRNADKKAIREALFNVLAHGDFGPFSLYEARVLDLFAGTGALGLEALSRGASFALFVDDHSASRGLIRTNAEHLGLTGRTKLYKRDAAKLGPRPTSAGPAFNLVFADPPYGKGLGEKALVAALEGDWIAPGALIVLEEDRDQTVTIPQGFVEVDRRTYAATQILLLQVAP
eukprot:s1_g1297.t1